MLRFSWFYSCEPLQDKTTSRLNKQANKQISMYEHSISWLQGDRMAKNCSRGRFIRPSSGQTCASKPAPEPAMANEWLCRQVTQSLLLYTPASGWLMHHVADENSNPVIYSLLQFLKPHTWKLYKFMQLYVFCFLNRLFSFTYTLVLTTLYAQSLCKWGNNDLWCSCFSQAELL